MSGEPETGKTMSKDSTGRESGGVERDLRKTSAIIRNAERLEGEVRAFRADAECEIDLDHLRDGLRMIIEMAKRHMQALEA